MSPDVHDHAAVGRPVHGVEDRALNGCRRRSGGGGHRSTRMQGWLHPRLGLGGTGEWRYGVEAMIGFDLLAMRLDRRRESIVGPDISRSFSAPSYRLLLGYELHGLARPTYLRSSLVISLR